MFDPCIVVQYSVCFLVLWSSRWGRESWLVIFVVLLILFSCYRSLLFPHAAVVLPDHTN